MDGYLDGTSALQCTSNKKVPVILLTGFLGSGKTSRLNRALQKGSSRIAVIENELGALGVDGALVANTHDDGVIELTNGCLCCSGDVDLIAALESLSRRYETRPFDVVIIETTGLADVGPVIALLRDPEDDLSSFFVFSGTITVVDSANFRFWNSSSNSSVDVAAADMPMVNPWRSGFGGAAIGALPQEASLDSPMLTSAGRKAALLSFWRQVALADKIIVSKTDLTGDDAIADVQKAVTDVNPFAEIVIDRVGADGSISPLPTSCDVSNCSLPRQPVHAAGPLRLCGARTSHLAGVDALTFRFPVDKPFNMCRLKDLVAAILTGEPYREQDGTLREFGDAWRVKGIVPVAAETHMLCNARASPVVALLQGVGDQVELNLWAAKEQEKMFVVVIGTDLRRDLIEAALETCIEMTSQQDMDSMETD